MSYVHDRGPRPWYMKDKYSVTFLATTTKYNNYNIKLNPESR